MTDESKSSLCSVTQFMVGVDTSTVTATSQYFIQKGLPMCQCVANSTVKMTRYGVEICKQCGRYLKSPVKTQKARGILQLAVNLPPTTSRNTHYVVKNLKAITNGMPWEETLARPCPIKPRPGFVDSRRVDCREDLITIQKEIKASGEDKGELLLARYLDAPHSGILTNTSITVGGGTDGATTGKDAYIFPLLDPVYKLLNRHVELLWMTPKHCYAVQYRAAKDVPIKRDYITGSYHTINQIITPKGPDLLEWEKQVIKNSGNYVKNTVAYLPGHPLTSHFCLHAIMVGMNVITSYKPKAGNYLGSSDYHIAPLEEYNSKFIHKVIMRKEYIDGPTLMLAMAILHHWPAIDTADIPDRQKLFAP